MAAGKEGVEGYWIKQGAGKNVMTAVVLLANLRSGQQADEEAVTTETTGASRTLEVALLHDQPGSRTDLRLISSLD